MMNKYIDCTQMIQKANDNINRHQFVVSHDIDAVKQLYLHGDGIAIPEASGFSYITLDLSRRDTTPNHHWREKRGNHGNKQHRNMANTSDKCVCKQRFADIANTGAAEQR